MFVHILSFTGGDMSNCVYSGAACLCTLARMIDSLDAWTALSPRSDPLRCLLAHGGRIIALSSKRLGYVEPTSLLCAHPCVECPHGGTVPLAGFFRAVRHVYLEHHDFGTVFPSRPPTHPDVAVESTPRTEEKDTPARQKLNFRMPLSRRST